MWPLCSNSDPEYNIFFGGDHYKPWFATTTGKGTNPTVASSFKLYTFFPRIRTTQKNSLTHSTFSRTTKIYKGERQRQAIQKKNKLKKKCLHKCLFLPYFTNLHRFWWCFFPKKNQLPNGNLGTFSHLLWTSPPRPRTGKGLPSLGAWKKWEKTVPLLIVVEWLSMGLPSRGLTYPTLGKGKSSSKCHFWGIC